MEKSSLTALTRQQLKIAQQASSGRSAKTVYGGHEHVLRQTLIALAAGHKLDDHDNPGEACTCCTGGCGSARGTSAGKAPPGISSSCPTPGTPSKRSKTPPCCSPWPSIADTALAGRQGTRSRTPTLGLSRASGVVRPSVRPASVAARRSVSSTGTPSRTASSKTRGRRAEQSGGGRLRASG